MELYRQRDLKRCGIYCIINKVNGKRYIGKSINIYERIRAHINLLNKKSKNENSHFINSWHKHGRDNFEYVVLEDCDIDNELLKNKELYWMKFYNTIDRNKGYNIRMDSSTGIIVSKETRSKLSKAQIKRFKDPLERLRISKASKEIWKDEVRKQGMIDKLKTVNSKYKFHQYTREGEYIKTYNTISDVINENPSLRKQNIYQVCYGLKPTHGGYVWKKELKI